MMSDCMLWTGYHAADGYGRVYLKQPNGKPTTMTAHRWAYIQAKGPVAKGWHVDHLCRVRHCVNPDHLEAVPHRTNILRGNTVAAVNAKKIRCNRGHDYTPETTYIEKSNGKRHCMICRRMRRSSVI